MRYRMILCAALLGGVTISIALAPAFAAPITSAVPFAFRDNAGPVNFLGQGSGDEFSFGVHSVSPNANAGTTATAANTVMGEEISPLPDQRSTGRPGVFGVDRSFVAGSNQHAPWEVTVTNEDDTRVVATPDRRDAPLMGFVDSLSISGPATEPTISWDPPAGASPDFYQYELWDVDEEKVLTGSTGVPVFLGEATEVTAPGETIEVGRDYAVRVFASKSGESPDTLESRSSNWLEWTAQEGEAEGRVLALETGSPASVTQVVDTPADPFNLMFDYLFDTLTGELSVSLDGERVGRPLALGDTSQEDYYRSVIEIEREALLGRNDVALGFTLDGEPGSRVLIDNVSFAGMPIPNGDFSGGLEGWTASGPGTVSIASVPEPRTLFLLCVGLVALGLQYLRRNAFPEHPGHGLSEPREAFARC
ncbi:fibronectin type III domain-containing protein [Arhodomonas sp. SL1]|uniref:fibronectin type III domain-containing protein n=1 Tax=Arhodomonas sp. SL1 TaxID=3425691 RepID=UPI003F88256F